MYQVKAYNRSNGQILSESNPMGYLLAMYVARVTGSGEGYWVEIVKVYPGHTVTLFSTV